MATLLSKPTKLWTMDNRSATCRLNALYKKYKDSCSVASNHEKFIIEKAINVYNAIGVPRQYPTINAMLKICIHWKRYDVIVLLWDDIQHTQRKNVISCTRVLRCLVNLPHAHVDQAGVCTFSKCMQILQWMQECNYQIMNYEQADLSLSVSKLIDLNCSELCRVQHIHRMIADIFMDRYIATALINAYAQCGQMETALSLFDAFPHSQKETVMIGVLLKALVGHEQYHTALHAYDQMCAAHIQMDNICHILALKACMKQNNYHKGKSIIDKLAHSAAIDVQLSNAFITFFGHFNEHIQSALDIFYQMPQDRRDVVSYSSIMKALIDAGRDPQALQIYDEATTICAMDDICHTLAVKACIHSGLTQQAADIIEKQSFHSKQDDVFIQSVLIDFHGTCQKDIESARSVFNKVTRKNIVVIGAMMQAYFDCDLYQECIELFQSMKTKHALQANDICFAIALKACTMTTAYHTGIGIHHQLMDNREYESLLGSTSIQINLINFYGKCGAVKEARCIFEDIRTTQNEKLKTEISIWNAMIHAYSRNSDANSGKQLLQQMQHEYGLAPDRKTFIVIIHGCSHCGDAEQALDIWRHCIADGNIKFDAFLVSTLVDCVSRRSQWDTARQLITDYEQHNSDKEPHFPMWMALLSALSQQQEQRSLIQAVFLEMKKRFGERNDVMTQAMILMSNMYARNTTV